MAVLLGAASAGSAVDRISCPLVDVRTVGAAPTPILCSIGQSYWSRLIRVDTMLRQLLTALGRAAGRRRHSPRPAWRCRSPAWPSSTRTTSRTSTPGQLVLVIGARGRDAVRTVRAVGRAGAAAVAVKAEGAGRRAARRGGRGRRRPAHRAPRRALGAAGVAGPRRARRGGRGRRGRAGRPVLAGPDGRPAHPRASWSSRTPRAGCWPTRARTATPPRSTSCAGCRSWAGRGRPTTCGCCASGACSTGCAPARTWCTSTSGPSWASGPGWPSASTPGSAVWARSGCRKAPSRSPSGPRTCCSGRPGWPPGT